MKNTYLVSELFFPNKTSTAYIMTEIAKAISVIKKINVITADSKYDDNISENESIDYENLIIHKPIKVYSDKNSITNRIKNSVGVSLSFGWFLLKKIKKGDTVFAVTNPFILVVILALLRSFKSFQYILLIHDVFPENAIPAGILRHNSISYKVIKCIYDWSYGKADTKIVLGRDMMQLVSQKTKKGDIKIIENWFDEDLNIDIRHNRNKYLGIDVDNKIVIGFSGNIGRVQNLFQFVKLFSKTTNEKLHFVIIGDGAESNSIKEFLQNYDNTNISYFGSKPRCEQSLFLSCFDIGLVSLSEGMYGLGVPSKTYNNLAMSNPILYIGDKGSEIDLLINQFTVGWSFTWKEEDTILHFLNSLEIVDQIKINHSKNLALNKYTSQIILDKIIQLVNG